MPVCVWAPLRQFVASITGGPVNLNRDFKEFIASLNANGVRYLIVGGYAVAFHGHPRYTKDLDVWIEISPENAARVLQSLEAFGFGAIGLKPNDFEQADQVVQLGRPPQRIDLLTSADGVSFAECHAARIEAEIDGVKACFINLDHLKRNKRASGRHQDLADIENLEN